MSTIAAVMSTDADEEEFRRERDHPAQASPTRPGKARPRAACPPRQDRHRDPRPGLGLDPCRGTDASGSPIRRWQGPHPTGLSLSASRHRRYEYLHRLGQRPTARGRAVSVRRRCVSQRDCRDGAVRRGLHREGPAVDSQTPRHVRPSRTNRGAVRARVPGSRRCPALAAGTGGL